MPGPSRTASTPSLPLIRGESVLDVGCAARYGKPDWLHGLLSEQFPDAFGIDIDQAGHPGTRGQGIRGTASRRTRFRPRAAVRHGVRRRADRTPRQRARLPPRVCGATWHREGAWFSTTPNVFYIGGFVYRWGGHGQVHPQHTCWYCEDTLRQVLVGEQLHGSRDLVHRPTTARRRCASPRRSRRGMSCHHGWRSTRSWRWPRQTDRSGWMAAGARQFQNRR